MVRFIGMFLALALLLTAAQDAKAVAIEHYVARASSEQTKTTNGWSAVSGTSIAGTNFTVGEKYLILVWGEHNSSNGGVQTGIRITHGGTAFTESQTIEETDRTGASYKTPYFWFTVWTAANENLEVEYYNSDATATYTARVEDVTLLAINAEDLIDNEDLQYDIQTTGGTLTTTPTTKASFTWTPAKNGDTWWIMAYTQADIIDVQNGDFFLARIDIDGTDRAIQQIEGEDATDTPLYGLGWVTTLNNTSHTVAVQLSESAADEEWDAAGIFALRLNAFEQFATDATAGNGPSLTVEDDWYELAGVNPDVSLQGDWLIAAGAIADDDDERLRSRIQLGGSNITDTTGGWQHDDADLRPNTVADFQTNFSTGAKDLDFDGQRSRTESPPGSPNFVDAWMVAFSMELNCTFEYRKSITIDAGEVGGSVDLTNFPVLISLTDMDLMHTGNGGHVKDSGGADIIFRSKDSNTCSPDASPCTLDHEIEHYDSTTGELIAWVRIPVLDYNDNTVIYMYYGNACVDSGDMPTPEDVWNSKFELVQHLNETSGTHYDSTSNNSDSTSVSVSQQGAGIGKIDEADEFDGTDDLVTFSEITIDDDYTIEFWMSSDDITNRSILGKHTVTNNYAALINATTIRLNHNGSANMQWTVPSMSTGTFYHIAFTKDTSDNWRCYLNGSESSTGAINNTNTFQFTTIGQGHTNSNYDFDGILDEVRISSTARSAGWFLTSFNNQDDPGNIGSPGFYSVGSEETDPVTAVSLLSFTAQGEGNAVEVSWQTAREWDNVGFHIYRATAPAGPFARITDKLISATVTPGKGGTYSYLDEDVQVGTLYYYKLEDIDAYGKHTEHGPICVDWDADGMADDWEITNGLNPWVNDADLDYDEDGLSNLEEYERGLNPFNADTDGDGIPDGDEDGRINARADPGSRAIGRGVEVIEHDDTGMRVVLNTAGFEAQVLNVGGAEYEQLSIADYVHGYTGELGAPQLPLKGLLIDVPAGKAAELTVVDSELEPYSGYRVYPVPEAVLDATGGMAAVGSVFVQNQLSYNKDGFYPQTQASLGNRYLFGEQIKQQVIFYPLAFNPLSGELNLFRRIELRIDFVDDLYASTNQHLPSPWQVPKTTPGVLGPIAVGLAAAPSIVNPISPLLSSLGAAAASLWSPPAAADSDVYKIITEAEGIHRITKNFLDTNGVDTAAISLSQLRIYYLGQEVAIEVFDQNSDDQMDAADFISFYARPVSSLYAKYSGQNVYWLTLSGGAGVPLRMGRIEAAPVGGDLAADFADSAHHEQNQIIWIMAPGADSIERWFFWSFVQGDEHAGGGQPVNFTVNVPAPTSDGTLTVLMAGQTDTFHEVKVAANGVEQTFSWTGISYYQVSLDNVPLNEGDNTVSLQCLSADGNDSIIVDWFKINYWRDYVAQNDRLAFAPDSGQRYLVDGFTTGSILAYDISDPADVAIIDNAAVAGAGPYSLEFEPAVFGDSYLTLSEDEVFTPVGLISDSAGNLADTANGADYILITHRYVGWQPNGDQRPWLTDLVAHRQDQGLRVFVADIEDIFDAFSFGVKSPHAVKDFLAYAHANWTAPAPQHVLLVGDATYDPKNHWNEADTTAYLPTYSIYTDHKGETVSDQWFVTFAGDDAVADMHIGRLPAADAAQAQGMVDKIIAYEAALNAQSWTNQILLIADNQRPGSQYAYEAAFESINEDAAALIPEAMADPFRGYLNDYAAAAFLTDDIIDALNSGALMVNYAGHGATQILADEHIFEAADVAALTNTDRLSFFVSMACEAGFFAYPETWSYPSLAEALLRSNAGAVAALMPTGMSATEGQQILDAALFEAIFTKDIRTLGPAIADAKQTLLANGQDDYAQISDTFLLFGDPATVLKVPLPHVPTGVAAGNQSDGISVTWDAVTDCNDAPVAGYNIYRAASAAGPFAKINTALVTDTGFIDAAGGPGAKQAGGGSGSYYAVSAVDDNGFESARSLAVKPASAAASGGSVIGGCFISTAAQPDGQQNRLLWALVATAGILVLLLMAKITSSQRPEANNLKTIT